jgi:hypothetical protein
LISENIHIAVKIKEFKPEALKKGTWLAIIHAQRIPPHIGLIISGNYNSLTIKEHELNINSDVLIKTIIQKKIKSVFVKVVPHPVFSLDHQLAIFQEHLKTFGYVKQNENTCLSPIKQFFQEFYAIPLNESELLFDFMIRLNDNDYLEYASALNMELDKGIDLPCYTIEELNEKIKTERQPYYND